MTIKRNNQAVKIRRNGEDGFYALHLVNTRRGVDHADAQVVDGRPFRTERGAVNWANRVLGDA